jgi:hypothetical protein
MDLIRGEFGSKAIRNPADKTYNISQDKFNSVPLPWPWSEIAGIFKSHV